GLQSGVITPGQSFYDSPIKIAATPALRSWSTGLGTVNDITALQKSSNVYMGYIALKMMGENRYPYPENAPPSLNDN
ncbi:penicillin-binding transpeptidase domain-containing protein, partial [Staphylococcus sp. SIMBA_130]